MFKNTIKLTCLLFLLVLSFLYTDKAFGVARSKDPIMKQVISYKKENDVMPVEPIIKGDELVIGYSGLTVDENSSYKLMKEKDEFNKDKIIYESKLPKTSITNTYKYYVKKGNNILNNVSIIIKITDNNNIDEILKFIKNSSVKVAFFVDGRWLENNVELAFKMVNFGSEIYNLGYDGIYDDHYISITNNLIESITLKNSNFCLNENKNTNYKKTCDKKKMLSISPTIISPTIINLKENITKGAIISLDQNEFNLDTYNIIIKAIISRGYKITALSELISEKRK